MSLVSSGKAAGECQRTYRGVVAPLSGRLAPKIRRNLHLRASRVALVSAHFVVSASSEALRRLFRIFQRSRQC